MNEYGKRAQENWQRLAPGAYSLIPDPSQHFSTLGLTAQDRVADLTTSLLTPDEPGEAFWHKVGRLTAAKRAAEEIVWSELLTPPQESWEQTDEDLDLTGMAEADLAEARQAETVRAVNEEWSRRRYEMIDLLHQREVPEDTIATLAATDLLGAPDAMSELTRLGLL